MSGWLLMGLPGVAYWCGIADAAWTAIGLAVGTYINWLIVSKRLRRYSVKAGNAITLPEYFSNRFHEKKKVIMTISAIFILIFFTVYAASCLVTCGKLFSTLFDMPYIPMMIVGAVFVLVYTIIGGFLAESASDFMQAVVMIIALIVTVIVGTAAAGDWELLWKMQSRFRDFLNFSVSRHLRWQMEYSRLSMESRSLEPRDSTAFCLQCLIWHGGLDTLECPRYSFDLWLSAVKGN